LPGEEQISKDVDRLNNIMTDTYKEQLLARAHDPRRLRAVYGTGFLKNPPKKQLANIVAVACKVTKSPGGTLNLLDSHNQRVVIDHRPDNNTLFGPTPDLATEESICMHTLMLPTGTAALSMPDTVDDGRVCNSTIVTEGGLRAYLGVPLLTDGFVIGSLCVYDKVPRDWSDMDVMMLTTLASEAMALTSGVL
jgi:GAF domain-containing protein